MSRKVIIDCDPGIDDAVALCVALFDPRLEVVAVTAAEGNVSAERTTLNVQAIIDQLDPARYPRMGAAVEPENVPPVNARYVHGDDGLGNAGFDISSLRHQHPADKIISDEIRSAPGDVTLICLAPLTNVARALQRDRTLTEQIDQIIMMGGSVNGIGNVTPAAEFNVHCDPPAARSVFRSPITKTLIPLDVTRQVTFGLDLMSELPPESTRAGLFLRKILPFYFRSYHQRFGQESIQLHDTVALVAAIHPELFETEEMAGDVETRGELTAGATVFDRRPNREWRSNMAVATGIDVAATTDCIVRGLVEAGRCTA